MPAGETVLQRNRRVFGTERPVAFVTGSRSRRVGNVIAAHLTEAKFEVVLHGRSAAGANVLQGDVAEEDSVQAWAKEVVARFGRVDLLVNSAAIWEPKPLEETEAKDFEHFFRVNSLGTALACKHFGLQMTKQKTGGSIVNIGDWAIARPYRDFSAYFPSKGAIGAITQSMAVELAERNPNVRVNAILPGPVMLAEQIDDERRARIAAESLLKRDGKADDVAEAVLYFATSQFVTGVCLPVDGGRTIYSGASNDSIAHPEV